MSEHEVEARLVALESLLARQERYLDELNGEILRLNRLHERLLQRFEAHEARQSDDEALRALGDEPLPPHY